MPGVDDYVTTTPRRTDARREARQAERARRRKRTLIVVLSVIGGLLLGAVAYSFFTYRNVEQKLAPKDPAVAEELQKELTPVVKTKDPGPQYVLILGADRRPGQTNARSDTIVVMRLDQKNKKVSMLSIPRDTRVPVDGHGLDKITHANAYGGPALAVKTVKEYTGLPIHHFMEIDFAGFAKMVNAMGGITLNVDRAINDRNGSNTGGVSSVTHIPAGVQHLNGQQALTFVRSRAFADGDFTRIKHQQQFLKAFVQQALEARNIPRLPAIGSAVADNVETDMKMTQLLSLARQFKGLSGEQMQGYTAPGRAGSIGGVSYVIPYEQKTRALIAAFKAGKVPAQQKQ